ncbi:hypothetical protein MPSEU_000530100 [Mayamaea pseudoterrestris]|nr:hypothetical protein MPSEU_000530100 [Mayamaea pseudoterrestris]
MADTDATIRAFVEQQRVWLLKELQCDNVSTEEGRSHVLHQLEAIDVSVGLYGRTVLTLASTNSAAASNQPVLLPAHRFTSGDEVEIRAKSASSTRKLPGGVISQVTEMTISVALFDGMEGDSEHLTPPLSILPRSSIEVHKKLMMALEDLEKHGTSHSVAGPVIRAAFDPTIDRAMKGSALDSSQIYSKDLNESQLDAISFALTDNRPISLIHGPPGTGKTTTVVELIQQAVITRGFKVLVAAPSNIAVDNILERLLAGCNVGSNISKRNAGKLRVVRLGHPARLQPKVLPHSLEALVQKAEGTEIVSDVRSELNSFLRILNSPKSRANDKRLAYKEVKALRKELRTREEKVVQELLNNAQVVLATCVGASNRLLRDQKFDLVIIDEAAQALETECWIPALRGVKLVLAGDHCQLPPTIKSTIFEVERGLSRTMFERVMDLYGDIRQPAKDGHVSRMLNVQYRMHETISDWASQAMYHGQLRTHEDVRLRTLLQLTGQSDDDNLCETALMLIDTSGCHMHESVNAAGSRYNVGEAEIVARQVRALVNVLGVQQEEIAVITPYNGQVEILRTILLADFPKLEIRSVDGFQGGEREVVILSLVRSSERCGKDGIGFLQNERRLNVAITRAKRHCSVICDSETVSQSLFIKNLLAWIDEHGDPRSALDYSHDWHSGAINSDMLDAECVLNGLLKQSTPARTTKDLSSQSSPRDGATRRKELLHVFDEFVESAGPGDAMSFSSELNSYDRMLVHEEAEKRGIGHCSEGDGSSRRLVLSLPATSISNNLDASEAIALSSHGKIFDGGAIADNTKCDNGLNKGIIHHAALIDLNKVSPDPIVKEPSFEVNNILGSLANERKERDRHRRASAGEQERKPTSAKGTKSKKSHKLGGRARTGVASVDNESLNGLDDIAFLEVQIEKVQTSHGRTIDAKGAGYRTIVNGVLLAKPKAEVKKQDACKSAALQKKLQQAQLARKTKSNKK